MNDKVLIAYATKHGATAEIAERIGEVLRLAGLQAEVLPAALVRDVSEYRAVVVGSAVYIGLWRREAVHFVRENQHALAERPLWLFSSGPTVPGDPAFTKGRDLPAALQGVADAVRPRDVAVFSGALDITRLGFMEKKAITRAGAPTGDHREWARIEAWSEGIARELA